MRTAPQISMANTVAMKPYVGRAKTVPDSLIPRRFITVRIATAPSETCTACGESAGNADTTLATPAATETATVST